MLLLQVLAMTTTVLTAGALYVKRAKSAVGVPKQGAYGKVPVYKHSLWEQLSYPEEVLAMFQHWSNRQRFLANNATLLPAAIWQHLDKTSRSFALVIRVLPSPVLGDAVCIFYLLLRALDTVEDETELSKFAKFCKPGETELEAKVRLLQLFANVLVQGDDSFPLEAVSQSDIGFGAERDLLAGLSELVEAYHANLDSKAQEVVFAVCREMALGMSEYVARDMSLGTRDLQDYDRYCHIVAGLVGRGLTQLFVGLGFERDSALLSQNWNEMGLMLQRTNITRDFCEDLADHRLWWPKSVTSKYASDLHALKSDVSCLNEMVAHALELVPNSLDYLDGVENEQVFAFCSVPQIMAVATLQACYGNKLVYTGVVKIRTGLGAKLLADMLQPGLSVADRRRKFQTLVLDMVGDIQHRAEGMGDDKTAKICSKILSKCTQAGAVKSLQTAGAQILAAYALFVFAAWSFRRLLQV
ncbi:farnesyl-diphosphate farnesyltransferase [Batrachochytrium salamandrivorans]|nr:farnesyl-diphosphate farnesyltransferase [Batrachochytrium salamandrivorans]